MIAGDAVESVLQCPYCRGTAFSSSEAAIACNQCGSDFPNRHGIVNTLIRPSADVLQEIRGGMKEAGIAGAPIESYIFRHTPRIETLAERKARTKDDGYYSMTELNFEKACGHLSLRGTESILEVGGNFEFPFMRMFAQHGCRCYETNIFFYYDEASERDGSINRIAGDMMALPYRDDAFDVVLFSAALHHAPDLDIAVSEISRVLKRGGTALILTEPSSALLKRMLNYFDKKSGEIGRDEDVHEGEYAASKYKKLFHKHGFSVIETFFSPFYDERLKTANVGRVRFAPVARVVAAAWKVAPLRRALIRYGLPVGQALLGLQLNLVLRKTSA